jgi:hypothetical protein
MTRKRPLRKRLRPTFYRVVRAIVPTPIRRPIANAIRGEPPTPAEIEARREARRAEKHRLEEIKKAEKDVRREQKEQRKLEKEAERAQRNEQPPATAGETAAHPPAQAPAQGDDS